MRHGPISRGVNTKSTSARRWRMLCFLMAVLSPSIGSADDFAGWLWLWPGGEAAGGGSDNGLFG